MPLVKILKNFITHSWLPTSIIVCVTILLYAKTISFDYTYLDDNRLLQENFWFIQTEPSLLRVFQTDVFLQVDPQYYRPLLTLSFIPDALLAKTPQNLVPFRVSNLLYHLTATLLLLSFLQSLGYSKKISSSLSFLFAIHPGIVQAVAWIPGRNDSLLTVFVLGCLLAWQQFVQSNALKWLALHMFLLLCALLTKESAISLPLIVLGLSFVYKKAHFSFEKWWGIGMGWLVVILVWFLLRSQVIFVNNFGSSYTFFGLLQNIGAITAYAKAAFIPVNQSVLQITENATSVTGAVVLLALLFYAALCTIRKKTITPPLLGIGWFVVFLLPSVVFHDAAVLWGQDLQLTHRLYLPLVGIALVLADFFSRQCGKKTKLLLTVAFFGFTIFFITQTLSFSTYFSDRFSFWNQAVATSPNSPLAHRNLAVMHHLEGRLEEAKEGYLKALSLNPNEPMVNNNLGLLAQDSNSLQEAEMYYRKEIELNQNFPLAYDNLAELLMSQGEVEEARSLWLKNKVLDPYNQAPLIKYALSFKETDQKKYQQLLQELKSQGIETTTLEAK